MGASLSMGECCTVPPPISRAPPLPPAEAGQRLSGGGEAVVGPTEVVDLVVEDALKPLPPETPTRTTTGRPPSLDEERSSWRRSDGVYLVTFRSTMRPLRTGGAAAGAPERHHLFVEGQPIRESFAGGRDSGRIYGRWLGYQISRVG